MPKPVSIVYLYEHVAREMDVACAVKCLVERNAGRSVEIVQWPSGYWPHLLEYRPAVVVLPFCYTARSFAPCLLEWRRSVFFNVTWEQLFYQGNIKAKTPRDRFATRHVIHHAWSTSYHDFLVKNGIPASRIFLNGHPAYALYREPYRRYFTSRGALAEKYRLDQNKKWLLFPENYNWAFYTEDTKRQFEAGGHTRRGIDEMVHYCDASLRQVLQWCEDAARDASVELILRPRPSTSVEQFSAFVRSVLGRVPDGLHIIQDETAREWILASDIVVSSHSTTLIEGAVAEKNIAMLEPFPMPASLRVDWHRFVPRVRTQEEFRRALDAQRDVSSSRPLREWAGDALGHGDAIRNLADFLTRLCSGAVERPSIPPRECITVPSGVPLPRWAQFEYRRMVVWMKRRQLARREVEAEYVKEMATPHEIRDRVDRWDAIL